MRLICAHCGAPYEPVVDELPDPAAEPSGARLCSRCVADAVTEAVLRHLTFANPLDEAALRRRLAHDDDGA